MNTGKINKKILFLLSYPTRTNWNQAETAGTWVDSEASIMKKQTHESCGKKKTPDD